MKRTLQLTSPYMRGDDVAYARRLLDNNILCPELHLEPGETWNQSAADAARRAKWELGYPESRIRGTFGTTLEKYLRGQAKLPFLYRRRRNKRLNADIGLKALAEARRWLGTTETPPDSNIALPFTRWYGWVGWGAPWCAVFVSYCLAKAGFKHIDPKAARWAYCPYMLADAKAARFGLRKITAAEVQPGDIVLFDWSGDGIPDHVGFFQEWVVKGSSFRSVEGNTSIGDDSNGGIVMERTRSVHQVSAFVKV